MRKPKILLIDDDENFVSDLKLLLDKDYDCQGAFSGKAGLDYLERKNFDLILLDIELGAGMDGFAFLDKMKEQDNSIPVIMITKHREVKTIVKAMKMGAYDYFDKKPDLSELKIKLNRALKEFERRRENIFLKEELQKGTGEILGESDAIKNIKDQIEKAANINSTVLVSGESGTGKELVARQIHVKSSRKNRPFVPVNCAAIPKELFESEFFGHEKGAFTGAFQRKAGKFEIANKGTIFLDEIAELSHSAQAKLLRVSEEKIFQRVGGIVNVEVDVRIISATNKDLAELIQKGEFREDLFYRLNVLHIHIPPLRDRRTDIPILANAFLIKKSTELKKNVNQISKEALDILISYHWPGNVRELQNAIERAIIHAENHILTKELFHSILNISATFPNYEAAKQYTIDKFQRDYITTMMSLTNRNITQAAERMGISRQGLQKMIKNLKINFSQ